MNMLFEAVVWNSLTAGLLAILVLILARFWKRPALLHVLWLVVLIKLVAPGVVRVDTLPRPLDEAGPLATSIGMAGSPVPATAGTQQPRSAASPISWVQLGYGSWIAGALLLGGTAIVRIRRFQRAMRHASPVDAEIASRAKRWAARVGIRTPEVVTIDAAVPPMIWGWPSAPRLILPAGLLPRLDGEELDTLLVHEMAHLKRGDAWVRWIELAVVASLWWNPLVWWVRANLRSAEEQACDAWVVTLLPRAKRAYANSIVKSIEFLAGHGHTPALATGATGTRRIKERLAMILNPTESGRLGRRLFPALLFALIVLPVAPGFADRDRKAEASTEREARIEVQREAVELERLMHELQELDVRRDRVQQQIEARRVERELSELARDVETLRRDGRAEEAAELQRMMNTVAKRGAEERAEERLHRDAVDRHEIVMADYQRALESHERALVESRKLYAETDLDEQRKARALYERVLERHQDAARGYADAHDRARLKRELAWMKDAQPSADEHERQQMQDEIKVLRHKLEEMEARRERDRVE